MPVNLPFTGIIIKVKEMIMLYVKICIGSSCYVKGSQTLIEKFQDKMKEYGIEKQIDFSGSFCTGKCNRVGVTFTIGNEIYTGITAENFNEFFTGTVLPALERSKQEA